MAGRRGGASVHQSMMRSAGRSEFKDELMRINQRQENRLALELEQWERAQRMVAKGLDKESQWFRQRQTQNPSASSHHHRKRPSLQDHSGELRLIPDYHFNRTYTTLGDNAVEVGKGGGGGGEAGPDADKKHQDLSSPSSKDHRKSGGKEEQRVRKGGAKQSEKTAHHKSTKHRRERAANDHEDSTPGQDDVKSKDDVSKSAGTDVTKGKTHDDGVKPQRLTEAALQSLNLTTAEKTPPSKPTTTTTTTRPFATTTTTADLQPTSTPLAVGAPLMALEAEGMVYGSPWDGRRRYANVWDTLSMPKNQSQVRSVRERLQREFTQVPSSATGRRSGGAEGRRGSDGRLASASTSRRTPKPSY